jgi:polysaccharide biosynthesis/export protein
MFKRLLAVGILVCAPGYSAAAEQETAPAKELIQYVRDARKAGLKDGEIQRNAEKAGWPASQVNDAIAQDRTSAAKPAPAATPDGTPAVARPAFETQKPKEEMPAGTPVASAATGRPPADPAPTATATPDPAPPAGARPAPANHGVPDEYQIGGGDVISINVWGEAAASVPGVVVRPDGKISMPLVKEVSVAGLTPTQLEKTITDLLADKIQAADVTVVVNQVNSKKVFMVGGGVKKEGPLPYSYRMTVMQALSEAGGLTDYAKRKKIYVLRNEDGRQFKLPFDYDAVLNGERMELNIPLIPGDIIVVPNH